MIQKKPVFAYEDEPAFHLKPDDAGRDVFIKRPHKAVLRGLTNPAQIATITPHCELPVDSLNGVPFELWEPPEDAEGWGEVDGQLHHRGPLKPGQKFSTGLVIMEPDGRLWMVSPTNGFGGYAATLPKGRFEEDEWSSWQSNTIWICLNYAFLSIVSKECPPDSLLVRAPSRRHRAGVSGLPGARVAAHRLPLPGGGAARGGGRDDCAAAARGRLRKLQGQRRRR